MSAPSNPYPTAPRGVDPGIIRQIRQASRSTSADFGLLMAQAAQESGFHPDARAAGSSAAGLFQFVDSTWLDMVRRFGAQHGMGALAQSVTVDGAGRSVVSDPATRQRILALRSNPQLSAALAGEYAQANKGEIEHALGRMASRADLYMAHFLGAGGATTFLKALAEKGGTPAAELLPEAAASNRAVFYDAVTGRARSVAEIYHTLGGRIEQEAQHFAAASTAKIDDGDAAEAASAFSPAPVGRHLDLAGLRLSEPTAAMLDAVTLAALKLITGEDPHPRQQAARQAS